MRHALSLASRGMKVFPLQPGSKVPAVARDWEGCATSGIEQIERWWVRAPYNIAVATGPSRLLVVDLDAPKDRSRGDELHGRQVLDEVARKLGEQVPSDTLTVATAGGGLHLYFRAPDDAWLTNTAGRLGTRIDTRAGGGYVVAPGSVVNRRPYRTVCASAPAPAPPWLISTLRAHVVKPLALQPTRAHGSYLRAVVAGEVRNVVEAPVSRRNHTLFVAAARLGRFISSGQLSAEDVRSALVAAADRHVGVHGFTPSEARRTIDSGLRRGTMSHDRSPGLRAAGQPRHGQTSAR
ncbi:MAG: bifunctional DNA primase/polymerase [Deltaproteobacteria bacterium]|nr:bifunctional DNA primase/polymerase [Deltaproteobacteria bacterium]